MKKVHLACGIKYLEGWINVDSEYHYPDEDEWWKKVIKHDLREPLPFEDSSIDFFFSEHFIEHLTRTEGENLVKETFRCLKPRGVSRVTTPDLGFLIHCYLNNILDVWIPEGWSAGTRCGMVNGSMRLWGHQFVYDFEELVALHRLCGFTDVYKEQHKVSKYPELNNIETRHFTGEMTIEAIK